MVPHSKLLDWKLDFYNPAHEKLYNVEYNPVVSQLMRILVGVGIVASAASPVVIYFLNREHAKERYLDYIGSSGSLFWCLLWFVLFFFKRVQNHASILCAFALGVFSVLSTVPSMITTSVQMEPFFASFYFLLEPFLRIRAKHSFFFGACGVLCLFIGSLTMRQLPVYNRISQALPAFAFLAISTYCGYYLEKRWKYDFYRRHLVQREAAKLKYAVARDASLLRNIFPKNLSDELEQQMANLQVRKKPSIPKPNTSSNVIVRVISNTALKLQKLTNSIGVTDSLPESPSLNMPHSLSFKIPSFSASSKPQLRVDIPRINSENSSEYGVAPLPTLLIPPVVSSPRTSPASDKDDKEGIMRTITSSGRPLHTPNNKAELHTFFTGSQHADGSLIALSHSYPLVTVIFADIVGFTSLSSTISAKELVTLLNRLFHKFDDIMEDLKLEKIRTIGDAYLCVGNMSIPHDSAEEAAVRAGQRMIAAVHQTKETLSLRVGIASGPLIAGVTGITKWNYDIFGKPLAHANLMETMAPPNCIAVSKRVHEIVSGIPDFSFERKETDAAEHGGGHGGGGWIGEENECYIMTGYVQVLRDIPSYASTDSEGENNLALLAQPMDLGMERQLSITLGDLKDYTSDSGSTESEDLEEPEPIPNYSRDDLITEENRVTKKWMPLQFISKILEDEYRVKSIQAVHTYTHFLCCVFACTSFTLLIADILETKGRGKQISPISVVIYLITIFSLIVYVLIARKYDYRIWATYVAVAVINMFGLNFVLIYFIDRTDVHVTWIILINMCMCSFLRAPVVAMLVTHSFDTLVTLVIIMTLHLEVAVRILMVIVVLAICYFAHRGFQRSLRKQFLATKRIKFDMHLQKITQHRAEMLIRNILPADIIPRIQSQASAGVVDLFEEATMMFINLTNLVELSADLDAANTFNVYNEIFTLFDEVTHSFGLEKIKTINTVYMVACSLPTPISNHVDVAVQFAAEIYRVISSYRYPQIPPKNSRNARFQVRIGLATGPVVAGIIGKRKYAYDCWSDTTNTASRMESNGWNGYLQLTPFSFSLLQNKDGFEKRENLYIKGKGNMDTYVLRLSKYVH